MYLAASDVAAVCGLHAHRTTADALLAFCKMNDSQMYEELKRVDAAGAQHWRARAACVATPSELEGAVACDGALERLVARVEVDGTSLDARAVRSAVYTTRGTRDETSQLDKYETASRRPVTARNSQLMSVRVAFSDVEGDEWIIRGRVDGMQDDCVVEHKRRQKRLFHRVPDYERVQCHVYMRMCDTVRARLVETHGEEQAVHALDFNVDFWADIVDRLRKFALAYAALDKSVGYASVAAFEDAFTQQLARADGA